MNTSPIYTAVRLLPESPREPQPGRTRSKRRDKDTRPREAGKRRVKRASLDDPRKRRKDARTEPTTSPPSSSPPSPLRFDPPPLPRFDPPFNPRPQFKTSAPTSLPAAPNVAVPESALAVKNANPDLLAPWSVDVNNGLDGIWPWNDLGRLVAENEEYKRREQHYVEEIARLTTQLNALQLCFRAQR